MRKGYDRTGPIRSCALQNLVLRVGFCLVLVLNSVEASPASTVGMASASHHTVEAKPVAVNNAIGFPSLGDAKLWSVSTMPGDAMRDDLNGVVVATEPPAFHAHGIAAPGRFKLAGSYDADDLAHASRLANAIIGHLRDDEPLLARHILDSADSAKYLDPDDYAALKMRVAAGLLSHGRAKEALPLAEQGLDPGTPEAIWTAGLAAFGAGEYGKSLKYFSAVSEKMSDPWSIAAASFWAGRSAARVNDRTQMERWLTLASVQKNTFYGMLAARVLDPNPGVVPARYESSAYSVPHWKPRDGFTVDPALLYAIMRQESKFDPEAQSNAGAIGLMQIMPHTAVQVMQRKTDWREALFDPQTNMDIGQKYIQFLLGRDDVSGNLILMAAAYNGGPTALARWRRSNAEEDPLLFLETWPVGETRGFIEQVLTNYWSYRVRLGQDTASLGELAHGRWPLYAAPALTTTVVADAR